MISLFVLAASNIGTVISGGSFLWSVGTVVVGAGISIFVAQKIAETKIQHMQEHIDKLERDVDDVHENALEFEKQVADSLKAIEIKLTELNTTISLLITNHIRTQGGGP